MDNNFSTPSLCNWHTSNTVPQVCGHIKAYIAVDYSGWCDSVSRIQPRRSKCNSKVAAFHTAICKSVCGTISNTWGTRLVSVQISPWLWDTPACILVWNTVFCTWECLMCTSVCTHSYCTSFDTSVHKWFQYTLFDTHRLI